MTTKNDADEFEFKTVTTRKNKYRVRQAESFQSLDTMAADWEVCEIQIMNTFKKALELGLTIPKEYENLS